MKNSKPQVKETNPRKVPPRRSVVDSVPDGVQTMKEMDILPLALPFKNPHYSTLKVKHSRQRKTLKQIITIEQTRGMAPIIAPYPPEGQTTSPVKGKRGRPPQNLINAREKRRKLEDGSGVSEEPTPKVEQVDPKVVLKRETISYLTPLAPPSLFPPKKYCDLTGLPAKYTDPKTKLHYRGLEVWDVIRGMGAGQEQLYLALRGAESSIR